MKTGFDETEGDTAALGNLLYEAGMSPERAERVARFLVTTTDREFGEED
ncbi:hypothetical protein [Umezawaea sp. NPDC059074]